MNLHTVKWYQCDETQSREL